MTTEEIPVQQPSLNGSSGSPQKPFQAAQTSLSLVRNISPRQRYLTEPGRNPWGTVWNLRAATALVVTAVAAFAAIQSYSHIFWFGRHGGQDRLDSALLPLSVDGLIVAMTLILLHESKAGRKAYLLTYPMLWLGIGATVAANVVYGLPFGPLGIASSAWPPLAFIGAIHVMARVLRTWSETSDKLSEVPRSKPVPGTALDAARVALAATHAAGNPHSERALVTRFGISRSEAKALRSEVIDGA